MDGTRDFAPKRATLRDVAQAAGVSHTTVSNAFARPDQLSASLRERVFETARALGYSGPNPGARSLRTGRHGAIGLAFSEDLPYAFSDPTAIGFLGGVAEACRGLRTNLLLIAAPILADGDPAAPLEVQAVRDAAVDGFVLYSLAQDSPVVASVLARGLPYVVVDQPRLPNAPFVGIDDEGGARQVAEHLLDLGHRRFAILSLKLLADGFNGVASPARVAAATYGVPLARLAGYRAALAQGGVDPIAVPLLECALNDERRACDLLLPLLQGAGRQPTAILAMSDRLALGAAAAARKAGLAVPSDISVVGFDDMVGGGLEGPFLTTIRQPHAEKGRLALQMLTEPSGIQNRIVPAELIVRGSTAEAAGSRCGCVASL
ncbi:MAG: LacI family DNA-binding transcriptional regulator [Janthinobacterium lividum]